ncbi:hypothetical protein JHN49_05280, partial [Streptomyces sp. MBT57]|nr:hypothetical protein [Streptomyces sp. MBT57]
MTMMSKVGGVLDVQDPPGELHNIPTTHLATARNENRILGTYEVSGCWFTHTRLYRAAEALSDGVKTGRSMVRGALAVGSEQAEKLAGEVKRSNLVGSVLPFRISFQVISYTMAGQAQEFATAGTAASANVGLSAPAHRTRLREMDQIIKQLRDRNPHEYRKRIKERAELVQEFEMRNKRVAAIERESLARAEKLAASSTQYALLNFRLRVTGGESGKADRYVSSGIRVDRSSLQVVAVPGLWMEVGLNWNETALPFYHKSWGGDLLVKLDAEGYPVIASYGENKFFSRFMSTSTGLTPIDESRMHGDGSVADMEGKARMRADRAERENRETAARANWEIEQRERRAAEEAEAKSAQARVDDDLSKVAEKRLRWQYQAGEDRDRR